MNNEKFLFYFHSRKRYSNVNTLLIDGHPVLPMKKLNIQFSCLYFN